MTQDTSEAPGASAAMSKYALRSPLMRLSKRRHQGSTETTTTTTTMTISAEGAGEQQMKKATATEALKAAMDARFVEDIGALSICQDWLPASPPNTTSTAAVPLAATVHATGHLRGGSAALTVPNSPLSRSAAGSPVPDLYRSSLSPAAGKGAAGGLQMLRRGRSFDPCPRRAGGGGASLYGPPPISPNCLRREKSINTVHYTTVPQQPSTPLPRREMEADRTCRGRLRREKSVSPAPSSPYSNHRRQQFPSSGLYSRAAARPKCRSVSEDGTRMLDDEDRAAPPRFISFREKSQTGDGDDNHPSSLLWRTNTLSSGGPQEEDLRRPSDLDSKNATGTTTIKDSIWRSISRLEQLSQEFEHLTSELSAIVSEEHELLGEGEGEEPSPHSFPANIYRLGRLNQSAQTDIRQAYLAYRDYVGAVEEFNAVLAKEAEAVYERAGRLGTGSQRLFLKVQPQAVARLRSAGETDDEEEEEDEGDEERNVFYAS
jgi:hypothetical protein